MISICNHRMPNIFRSVRSLFSAPCWAPCRRAPRAASLRPGSCRRPGSGGCPMAGDRIICGPCRYGVEKNAEKLGGQRALECFFVSLDLEGFLYIFVIFYSISGYLWYYYLILIILDHRMSTSNISPQSAWRFGTPGASPPGAVPEPGAPRPEPRGRRPAAGEPKPAEPPGGGDGAHVTWQGKGFRIQEFWSTTMYWSWFTVYISETI